MPRKKRKEPRTPPIRFEIQWDRKEDCVFREMAKRNPLRSQFLDAIRQTPEYLRAKRRVERGVDMDGAATVLLEGQQLALHHIYDLWDVVAEMHSRGILDRMLEEASPDIPGAWKKRKVYHQWCLWLTGQPLMP